MSRGGGSAPTSIARPVPTNSDIYPVTVMRMRFFASEGEATSYHVVSLHVFRRHQGEKGNPPPLPVYDTVMVDYPLIYLLPRSKCIAPPPAWIVFFSAPAHHDIFQLPKTFGTARRPRARPLLPMYPTPLCGHGVDSVTPPPAPPCRPPPPLAKTYTQLLHDDRPTTPLGVWACVVDLKSTQGDVLVRL